MPPVGYLRQLSLAWCALLALYGCDRVAGSAGHSGRDSARDSGGDSVGGVAPAGPDTAARARMTPVEQVSLFWGRVGREPRGRVCISTPATDCPKEPVEVAVTAWADDPFAAGAYTHVPVGSTNADLDLLGEPVAGRLLFAGEHTQAARVGYADGAMSSGIREAKRLLGSAAVTLGRVGA